MKLNCFSLVFVIAAILLNACSTGISQSANSKLDVKEFEAKLKNDAQAQILDVRTPDEFSKGHLENAVNIDWNGDNFDKEIQRIDKNKPVYVYCLGGGRSAEAAEKMRANGYKEVYEMNGGMMKWRAAGLPEANKANIKVKTKGMTKADFDALLETDKMVLIDFYADWCGPCRRMAPYMEELKTELKDRVTIVKINADHNSTLANELKVAGLPTLLLYQNKKLIWNYVGYISKRDLLKRLE